MGLDFEGIAGKIGLDSDTIKKATEAGDISQAIGNVTDVLKDKGIDVASLMDKIDLSALSSMDLSAFKDMDISKLSPDKIKELAEKLIKKD